MAGAHRAFAAAAGLLLLTGGRAELQTEVPILDNLLAILANPNVAYVLLVMGMLGIVGEIVTPGTVLPGIAGTIALILGLVGLGQLPTNWAGVALIVAAIVMFVVDFKVAGFGLSIGALIAFIIGTLLIFTPFWVPAPFPVGGETGETGAETQRLNPFLALGVTAGVGAFFFLGVRAAIKAQSAPIAVGQETMIGRTGIVRRPLNPQGIVHIGGEEWSAISADGREIPVGTSIRVVAAEGVILRVESVPPRGAAPAAGGR